MGWQVLIKITIFRMDRLQSPPLPLRYPVSPRLFLVYVFIYIYICTRCVLSKQIRVSSQFLCSVAGCVCGIDLRNRLNIFRDAGIFSLFRSYGKENRVCDKSYYYYHISIPSKLYKISNFNFSRLQFRSTHSTKYKLEGSILSRLKPPLAAPPSFSSLFYFRNTIITELYCFVTIRQPRVEHRLRKKGSHPHCVLAKIKWPLL